MFRRARLRLTLWFALVQLGLFAIFAAAVYLYVTTAFDLDGGADSPTASSAEAGFATLGSGLLFALAILLVLVPLTSFGLATLALRPVEVSFEAQQRFVDDASHELRTPLSALQAQLELALHRERPIDEYRDAIGQALAATRSLANVIADLLVLSRTEREHSLRFEQVLIGDVVHRAVNAIPNPDRNRIRIIDAEDAQVGAVPVMLERAVLNLLINALRYAAAPTPVEVTITRQGGNAVVIVTDHGIGMTAGEANHAFDRFWRAEPSRSPEGSGLGLAIVEQIIHIHRGSVMLRSVPGQGTTVHMMLPVLR